MLLLSEMSRARPRPRTPLPLPTHMSFFTLPAEIRLLVYEHLLVDRGGRVYLQYFRGAQSTVFDRLRHQLSGARGFRVVGTGRGFRFLPSGVEPRSGWLSFLAKEDPAGTGCDRDLPPRAVLCPTILCVCRQIYNEAVRMLYSGNVFDFGGNAYLLKLLLNCAGERNVREIRTLVFPPSISLSRPPYAGFAGNVRDRGFISEAGKDAACVFADSIKEAYTGVKTIHVELEPRSSYAWVSAMERYGYVSRRWAIMNLDWLLDELVEDIPSADEIVIWMGEKRDRKMTINPKDVAPRAEQGDHVERAEPRLRVLAALEVSMALPSVVL